MILKQDYKKLISAVLIFVLLISLSGCIPHWYTEEEEKDMNYKGNVAVAEWFAANEPTATYSDAEVYHDMHNYGLSDVFFGEYTLNGETYKYMYVMDSDEMYSTRLIDYASETTARLYAEGLGIQGHIEECKAHYEHKIEYNSYFDKGGKGVMETEKVFEYFPYLHYNSTEHAIDKNMESVLRRRADYNNTKLVYVLDKDIRFTDINIDYAIAHPYIYTIEIYNNQRTKKIYSIISVDSETKKRTMHVSYLSRSNVTDNFEKKLDYKYDLD